MCFVLLPAKKIVFSLEFGVDVVPKLRHAMSYCGLLVRAAQQDLAAETYVLNVSVEGNIQLGCVKAKPWTTTTGAQQTFCLHRATHDFTRWIL